VLYCVTAIGARATEFCSGTKHTQEFLGVDPTPTLGMSSLESKVFATFTMYHLPPTPNVLVDDASIVEWTWQSTVWRLTSPPCHAMPPACHLLALVMSSQLCSVVSVCRTYIPWSSLHSTVWLSGSLNTTIWCETMTVCRSFSRSWSSASLALVHRFVHAASVLILTVFEYDHYHQNYRSQHGFSLNGFSQWP